MKARNEIAARVGTRSGDNRKARADSQPDKANSTLSATPLASFAILDAGSVVALVASADAARAYLMGGA